MSIERFPKKKGGDAFQTSRDTKAPAKPRTKTWFQQWLAGETPPIVLNWKHAGGKPPEPKRDGDAA